MACPGEELIDPVRGQRLVFRQTAQETHWALVEVEAYYQPTSEAPPAHLHPHQEEHFEVISGSMTIRVNGQEHIYHAGETFGIPAGTAHAMWNGSEAETHLRWQTWPALHTEAFFEVMWGLAQAGKTNKAGGTKSLATRRHPAAVSSRISSDQASAHGSEHRFCAPGNPGKALRLSCDMGAER